MVSRPTDNLHLTASALGETISDGDPRATHSSSTGVPQHFRLLLEVFWFQASVPGDAGKHLRPDFLGVVEGPSEFAPRSVDKLGVRGALSSLYGPTDSE